MLQREFCSLDKKFSDLMKTAIGEERASVGFGEFKTLWFNTGTLCNIACANCYIESSPKNDRLVYLSLAEVSQYLDELTAISGCRCEIGFTGGEPFLNPGFSSMLELCLSRGFKTLTLTNAMKPLQNKTAKILSLKERYGTERLVFRVSIDHYSQGVHERERGPGSWEPMLKGLKWLRDNKFTINVAGRSLSNESPEESRAGYSRLFEKLELNLDAFSESQLIMFPEMDASFTVPEITKSCWDILSVRPQDQMCASSRMVVKRRGAKTPCVVSCTLLPYEPEFELGTTLSEASKKVYLNHPHCAKFCVLGGASCS